MKPVILLFALASAVQVRAASKYLVMPAIFSSNMVLQQKSVIPIWGKAEPGTKVTVRTGWGQSAGTLVDPDSSWMVHVKTEKAGGPYIVSVNVGDSSIVYKNVMLGEVWVCSGQSNMAITLHGLPPEYPIKNSAQEIKEANYPNIRFFSVATTLSPTKDFQCVGTWSECNPKTAYGFSAVGYFFGRELYRKLHVPIGLILSAYGGTKIQPWIAEKYLATMPYYKHAAQQVKDAAGLIAEHKRWVHSHRVIDLASRNPDSMYMGLNFDDGNCSGKNYNDTSWKTMTLPAFWFSTSLGQFNGAVWFRKNIRIPKSWVGSTLVLHLGAIDVMDETWVNGTKVGGILKTGYYAYPRVYDVPGSIVTDTSLSIAVRDLGLNWYGGLWGGTGVKMNIDLKSDSTQSIPLSGEWKYMPVAQFTDSRFYVYGPNGEFYNQPKIPFRYYYDSPAVLFNGMIAPIMPYAIRGVIWYQGESNSDTPSDYNNYKYLFPLLIRNWRADWKEGNFPFYWVQIAPFEYPEKWKSYVVRNAQRQTLSVPNTGMAVTLDIGTPMDIHPPDKQDVGHRLALLALAKTYGRHVVYSGPLYKSITVENGEAKISFKYVEGGLVFKPRNGRSNFVIAGKDSSFVDAEVKVVGKTLVVYSPKVKHPLAVRYAWGNAEQATLFNEAGLPASTFRTDDWPQ